MSSGSGPQTCPGFPGYCSESYPGQTCLVVCAFGRNNVPVCQVGHGGGSDLVLIIIDRMMEHGQQSQDVLSMSLARRSRFQGHVLEFQDTAH